jgi:cobalt-zinc-cadmium efflux system outer membrane protein
MLPVMSVWNRLRSLWLGLLAVMIGSALAPGRAIAEPAAAVEQTEAQHPSLGAVFVPTADMELGALMEAVRERAPALQEEHLQVELSAADLRQSRLVDNPVLDGAVATIPVGTPNPPDLASPLLNIPNYTVGLSLHPELALRGPRIRQAAASLHAAELQRRYAVRMQALRLLRALGDMAGATLRLGADQHLAAQARGALSVARERVRTGFGPPLDGDRAEIELMRLEQQVAADQADLLAAQATCAEQIGARCGSFPDESEARRFLNVWLARGEPVPAEVALRGDLQALAARRDAAVAEERLANAQSIPDPTVRVGYTYDRFVISGNQQNSFSVSLSFPVPLFDHGQAAAMAARARQQRLERQRRLLQAGAEARLFTLRQALLVGRQRLSALQQQVLPRVQAILRNVGRAFEARAVPLTDVIQAQRGLGELLLQEASIMEDTFRLTVDLLAESPGHE